MNEKTTTTGRRTRLRPGRAADYARIHAAIPEAVERALRECGVQRWHIWIDGSTLFHSIDLSNDYDRFLANIAALGPVDPTWDDIIAQLLETGCDEILPLVWAMDAGGQRPGRGPDPAATSAR